MWRIGSSIARRMMSTPTFWSPSSFSFSSALAPRSSATPPPGHDALFDRRLGRVHRVLDARLLLLHLGLGGRTDLDDGDAADQLREPLLQLLTVVVRGRVLDLRADLLDAALDRLLAAGALDDRRVVLVDGDLLGLAEILELDVLELDARGPR